jgi:hypothetical protein
MNNEINAKLEALEITLDKQQRKYKKTMIATIICYAVLALFVIIYTTYVMSQIRKLATPKTVAELIAMQVENRMPDLKEYVSANAGMYAKLTANEAVNYACSLIPSLGILVKKELDTFSDTIIQELSKKYAPALNEYFALHQDAIREGLKTLSDEEEAKRLSMILLEVFNQELDLTCANLDNSVAKLQKEINAITNKPNSQLSQREYAEKKFLIYWMFIVKHGKMGNSFLGTSFLSD